MKVATHPKGTTITFTESDHRYVIHNGTKPLMSVTTFIDQFFDKFDSDLVASKCVGKAKYAGLSAEEIKLQWKAGGKQSAKWGKDVHAFAESLFMGTQRPKPMDDHEVALFAQTALAVLKLSERFKFIDAEKVIFSPKFGLAGQVDLIMLDVECNQLVILDWKTNKKFEMDNVWQHAQPPVEHLADCHFIKYSLQLTLYEMILRHERYFPDVAGYRSAIIHLTEDDHRFIKPKDLTSAATWMMF